MIQEDYVSFEIALILKNKNFCIPTNAYYDGEGNMSITPNAYIIKDYNEQHNFILCPTLQMVMKWLREEHKIFIAQEFGWFHGDYEYQVSVIKMNLTIPPALDSVHYIKDLRHKTCEGACEKAIKYCLTHLI